MLILPETARTEDVPIIWLRENVTCAGVKPADAVHHLYPRKDDGVDSLKSAEKEKPLQTQQSKERRVPRHIAGNPCHLQHMGIPRRKRLNCS